MCNLKNKTNQCLQQDRSRLTDVGKKPSSYHWGKVRRERQDMVWGLKDRDLYYIYIFLNFIACLFYILKISLEIKSLLKIFK